MVIYKNTPVGIDVVVHKIQIALSQKLPWSDKITIYPKCYPILREGLRSIEHYSDNGDYLNLVTAEENKCFIVQSTGLQRVDTINYSTTLEIYFTVDLFDIYQTNVRRDSEAHRDVLKCLNGLQYVNVDSVVIGIENVFSGYSFQIKEDMQPYHCFKVVLNIFSFNPNQNNTC